MGEVLWTLTNQQKIRQRLGELIARDLHRMSTLTSIKVKAEVSTRLLRLNDD